MEKTNGKENEDSDREIDPRVRDQAVIDWCDIHPSTIRQVMRGVEKFHEIRFPCYQVAARRVGRLGKRKKLRFVGRVMFKHTGRPRDVYFTRPLKMEWVEHEVLLTDFFLGGNPERVIRCYDVNPVLKPDAEMFMKGRKLYVELDTGKTGYEQISAKMGRYASVEEMVLWVTLSKRRMEGLMKRAGCIKDKALFTVLGSSEWFDLGGNTC